MGGVYATENRDLASYASGYPHAQDLYLAETIEVSPDSGEVMEENGRPVLRGVGLLIRWEEIEFLEFIEG